MIGFGYDVHKLSAGESLILAGVTIDSAFGTVAHSDGDVVLHAVCDSLLGAAGLGDIGEHFPDTDARWKNADSAHFVRECMALLHNEKLTLVNLDIAIVLEAPKLKHYKHAMKQTLATLCSIDHRRVNIKATTSETLGFVGRGEGIEAFCVCLLQSNS